MKKNCLSESPFLSSGEKAPVFISHGQGAYNNTRTALSNINLTPAKGKRVLLKPNTGRIAPRKSGINTDVDVIAAAIDAFREAGAEVAVGESPISGVKTMEAFKKSGITEIAEKKECPLIDMDARAFVEVPVSEGIAIFGLKICPEVFEYDLVVSIPVMKTHMHTGVTLAIKNMKGCLWRRSKVHLHMLAPVEGFDEKPINIAISDMSRILKPHLAIIDGTVGMEGLGPSAGVPKPLDLVVVSAEPFAADAVACELMGIKADDVPYLKMGAERGYGTIDLEKIDVLPVDWKKWISPFDTPPSNLSIEFPDVTILDKNSCSACQSTLLLFLRRYRDIIFEYFPPGVKPVFAIGKGHDDVPEGTLCIGNCAAKNRSKGKFVPGCPPVGSEILSTITGQPAIDTQDGHSETPEIPED